MYLNHLKNFKRLGIILMSGIMLSSIAPFNSLNANASRRNHHSKAHRVIRHRRINHRANHRKYLRGASRTRVITRTRIVYRNTDNRLQRIQNKLNWLHSKFHVSPKVSNASLIHELQHSNHNLAHRLDLTNAQLNHYRSSLISTNRTYNSVKAQLRKEQHELRSLKANIPKEINQAVSQAKYNDNLTLNTITSRDRATLHKMHVDDINVITKLVNQDNLAQRRINSLEHNQQVHYSPARIPSVNTNNNVIKNNNAKLIQITKHQRNPNAKRVLRKIRVNHITRSERSLARINRQANDHPVANSMYIQKLINQANVIKQGISAHNKDVDKDYVNHFANIQAFNQIKGGKYLARKARRTANHYKNQIRQGIRQRKTNMADGYLDSLLEAKANPNNSLDQERLKHMSFMEAYKHANKAQKAQMLKLHHYIWHNRKFYKRGKKVQRAKRYTKRHPFKVNTRKYHKFLGLMSKIDRLKAKKQTKAVKAQEQALYKQTQLTHNQQISAINNQVDQISNEEASVEQQYKLVHDDWEDAEGNIPMRNKLHSQMRQLQLQLKGLQQQVGQLTSTAQDIGTQMDVDTKKARQLAYHHLIYGNIKSERRISSYPSYVRISTPTYYFSNLDISNKSSREFKVAPNFPNSAPVHKVVSAYQMTLSDGTSYTMYRINSNVDTEENSYYILAQYTTPSKKPVVHMHLKYRGFKHSYKGMINTNSSTISSLNPNARDNGHIDDGQTVKVLGSVYDKNIKLAYKVQVGHHKPVYADSDYVNIF